ncbi:MAG: type II secretion system F family protein [Candidatus Omnitrophica bacterium]|nr:type II secretion system F family protein [Candidatus Omnitrophota bacterium]
MPQFSYRAKQGPDKIKDGIIQAENEIAVIKKLREEGLYPVLIKEVSLAPQKKSYKKISARDISNFTRQIANLIHSGFRLDAALSSLSRQEQNAGLKKLIDDLQEKIQKGFTFSSALSEYPGIFSSFYINMINIGEATGKIDETLSRLADFKEKETELVSQVRAALVYPGFLLTVGIASVFVIITFLVPRFVTMFSELGQALPLPTQIVMHVGKFMNKWWWLFIASCILIVMMMVNYFRIEKNRLAIDRLMLRLPLIKDLIQKIEMARFSYALGVLLKSGVPIMDALGVVNVSVNNRVYRQSISLFQEKIRKGQSLSSCLKIDEIFPAVLINTVAIGEESGELAGMLLKTATAFESEANRTIKTAVTLIEPILLLLIGGFVIFLVLSIILPIFQMNLFIR